MIPKISGLLSISKNLLGNTFTDRSYTEYINLFKISKIKIGPFRDKHYLDLKFMNFRNHAKFDSSNKFEKTNFKYSIKEENRKGETFNFSIFEFNEDFLIDSDVKLIISSRKIKFYAWLNFFYSTLDILIHMIGEYMKDTDMKVKNKIPIRPSNLKLDEVIELGDLTKLKKKEKTEENIQTEEAKNISELFSNSKSY
jgi:hypothetical protein